MKFELTKYGVKQDVRGAHVTLEFKGRTLLGEVIGRYRDVTTGGIMLKVKHFNGEMWPFDPSITAVDVLERTYKDDYAEAVSGINPKEAAKLNKALKHAWNQ